MTQPTRKCSIDGCDSVEKARGWCTKHWKRWRRYGSPTAPVKMKARSAEESFERRTKEQGGCLIWTGDTTEDGYGIIVSNGRRVRAHRYAWERENGPIPAGLQIDHRCFNRACVLTSHLRPATNKQNNEHRPGPARNSTSGVRGVRWNSQRQTWQVVVKHHGKQHYGGAFDNLAEAEVAAIQLRNSLYTHNDLDRTP